MGMLDAKVAIVTGGTSGIGKRIAEVFINEGVSVILATRRVEEGHQVARELGSKARFIQTDVSNPDQSKAMADFAIECFGRIDCLVNNAGLPSPTVSILRGF